MTLEVQSTVPAGWYSDPGQSGGKRWWDGHQWTDNLQLAAPAAAAAAPGPNPYGLNGPTGSGYVPMGHTGPIALTESSGPKSNLTSWFALILGVGAAVLSAQSVLPGGPTYYVVAVGILAILVGVRALLLKRDKRASNGWAPVVGILLAGLATAFVLFGAALISLVGTVSGGMINASSNAPVTVTTTPWNSPEPIVFPQNTQLTQGGTVVQTVATALNRSYAAGQPTLASGQAWPTSLTMHGTAVLSPTGSRIATVPAGFTVKYVLSSDAKSYRVVATSADPSELATYDSSTNRFSWSCLPSDGTCVPTKN